MIEVKALDIRQQRTGIRERQKLKERVAKMLKTK